MRLIADYHMHTKYSGDSKNELEAIVRKAIELNLKEIAITDHGPAHSGYGIKKENFKSLRKEIDEMNVKYPQIRVLLGLEANILGKDGRLDIDEEMLSLLDWVNAGYHFGSNLKHDLGIHFVNVMSRFFKSYRKKAVEINTKAMVGAILGNKINMITHPGAKGPIDVAEVAKAAASKGTLLEINNSHGHLTVEEIKIAMSYDVKFAVCSDAHEIENIGKVDHSLDRAFIAGLTKERIFNIE